MAHQGTVTPDEQEDRRDQDQRRKAGKTGGFVPDPPAPEDEEQKKKKKKDGTTKINVHGGPGTGGGGFGFGGGFGGGGFGPPDLHAQGENSVLGRMLDMYVTIWGEPPAPGYIEGLRKKGVNFYEFIDHERAKPAFRYTKFYKDNYSEVAAQLASFLGTS